ncbi:MAG TPA: NAD(P)/FAD-dependent oxidoreductase [Thermoplasmata archaeon]|nr:NAD(P)/FAD-dependent oxidoreductase [Thermoplasmata archaeon]
MDAVRYDVIVIGGSYSGIAAALQLARARRAVLVLDAGERRNRFSAHSHGFLGQDGRPPAEIAAKGRAEVLSYPTVRWKEATATGVGRAADGFRVRAGASEHLGRRLILATGVTDELPPIPGLDTLWGRKAFFCPYCDGYEFHLGRLGVLATNPESAHYALLVSEWAGAGLTTFFLNGFPTPAPAEAGRLRARAIGLEAEAIRRVADSGEAVEVHLESGRRLAVDGLFLPPRPRPNLGFAAALGLEMEPLPSGPIVRTDATKETSVKGVFACGDIATPLPSVAYAVADGVRAGASAHQSLVFNAD